MKGTLSQTPQGMILTELASMEKPVYRHGSTEYDNAREVYDAHIKSLRSYTALGFSEDQIGEVVEGELGYQRSSEGGGWIDCIESIYNGLIYWPDSRRIVAIPAPIVKPGESEVDKELEVLGYNPKEVVQRDLSLIHKLKSNAQRDLLAKEEGSAYHETSAAREMAFKNGWDSHVEYASQSQQTGTQGDGGARPNIKDFFPEETDLKDIIKTYADSPHLFKYVQALDNYIDHSTSSTQPSPGRHETIVPTGVCHNCFNGIHDGCKDFSCSCRINAHKEWWREDGNKLNILFTDCWERDKNIPEEGRWLATLTRLGIVAVAPTKEAVFNEVMKSIMVKVAYDSGYSLSSPSSPQAEAVGFAEWIVDNNYSMFKGGWSKHNGIDWIDSITTDNLYTIYKSNKKQ